jgi:hypothetical protein
VVRNKSFSRFNCKLFSMWPCMHSNVSHGRLKFTTEVRSINYIATTRNDACGDPSSYGKVQQRDQVTTQNTLIRFFWGLDTTAQGQYSHSNWTSRTIILHVMLYRRHMQRTHPFSV